MTKGPIEQAIEQKLRAAFAPVSLTVRNDSAKHAGHQERGAGSESHFYVAIVAAAFEGKTRIARHRMINQALAKEFDVGLHALQLAASSPEKAE